MIAKKVAHTGSLYVTIVLLLALLPSCEVTPVAAPSSPLPAGEPAEAPVSPLGSDELLEPVAEEVQFSGGGLTLAGALTLPAGPGPHPALIFLTGSGPQDRNNGIPELLPGYQPYRQLAEVLGQRGVASLRYDDRGVGDSEGESATATSTEALADAEAALAYLRERTEIDPAQIGVLGHSRGGIVAAMLAAAHPEVAFVIGLAAPALSGYETTKDALARLTETTGLPPEVVQPLAERELQTTDLALAEEWDALAAHLEQTMRESLEQIPEEQREAFGDPEAFIDAQMTQAMQSYQSERFRDEMLLDPADALAQIEAPMLALYAEHETTVFADVHAPALVALMAGSADVTTATVPGVNHLFLEADDGNLQRFLQEAGQGAHEHMTDVPDRVVNRIVDWVVARVVTAR